MDSDKIIQQKLIEDSIKQEIEQTLSDRAERFIKVNLNGFVPLTHFAPASAECTLLFRDGHFIGCISLTQAVAEAITHFLCQINTWKPAKNYEENVCKLQTRKIITEETKDAFMKIWECRDNYHHLNITIETNLTKLQQIAYDKILLLKAIESEIFKFTITPEGEFIPKDIKLWDV